MILKHGLEKAVEIIVEEIKKQSRQVKTREQIAEVIDKVGKDGVITVEERQSLGLEKEYTEGMQFDRGYISAYFVTSDSRSPVSRSTSASARSRSSARARRFHGRVGRSRLAPGRPRTWPTGGHRAPGHAGTLASQRTQGGKRMARGDVVRLAIAEELRGTFTGPEDEVRWVDQRRKAFARYLEREWAQDEDNPGHPGVTGNGARLILTDTWEDELA